MNIYTKYLKVNSRSKRQDQTPAEIILWSRLRNRQFLNLKFRRQVAIEKYIVDYYSKELNLVIEIDGYSHDETK